MNHYPANVPAPRAPATTTSSSVAWVRRLDSEGWVGQKQGEQGRTRANKGDRGRSRAIQSAQPQWNDAEPRPAAAIMARGAAARSGYCVLAFGLPGFVVGEVPVWRNW